MSDKPFNVLFLCTGNSARSIMAESILNHEGKGRFRAHSAGSHPTGHVNPLAIELLGENRMPVENARSKDWSEFAKNRKDAPEMDFVITVCDSAAGEVCPVWPGQPMTAHWGVPDPAAVQGNLEAQRKAFREACHILLNRIRIFVSLPIDKLDRLSLQNKVRDIGRTR
jgi:protein-tyrosine-phosphatase